MQKEEFFYLKIFILTGIAGGFISLKQSRKKAQEFPPALRLRL
ncbi:hypothetical protein CLOSTMETH_00597 [[Clostridium] methylpentosum DSM 5476]|uniref:Uncharacterized protein n=1 Tax=[Clostridium] methylpentosum DSM 5476 TaxID=537013 RepID=C0E9U6_9FIRM|nr:hypothetical protein CLOSTMETH_00597 [[Clostridium] methylpentosum DSM 5476]